MEDRQRLLHLGQLHVHHRDACPFQAEPVRAGPTDAVAGAGDQRDFADQPPRDLVQVLVSSGSTAAADASWTAIFREK